MDRNRAGIHMHLHDHPSLCATWHLNTLMWHICKGKELCLLLFPWPSFEYYLNWIKFVKFWYLRKFKCTVSFKPSGPLHVGQQDSFGLQLEQTKWPDGHWRIGGSTYSKQTGHSKKLARSVDDDNVVPDTVVAALLVERLALRERFFELILKKERNKALSYKMLLLKKKYEICRWALKRQVRRKFLHGKFIFYDANLNTLKISNFKTNLQ